MSPRAPSPRRLAAPALVAFALLVAATAAANPPADYLGVNAQAMVKLRVVPPERWDQYAARMAADGLRLARVDAAWRWAEPNAPANGAHVYTWNPADRPLESLDRIMGLFARHGVRVVPAVTTPPAWAGGAGTRIARARFADFAAFAAAFAARYGSSGAFWSEHPELPRTPVREYQVWTEANSTHFWTGAPNAAEYLEALRLVAPAIRAADAQGAVLVSLGWQEFESYTGALYDGGLKGLVDGIGFQPYAPHAPAIIDLVRRMRAVMRAHGDAARGLYVTEIGQAAVPEGGASSAGIDTVSDAARAATQALAADALARSDCNVHDYLIYDLVDSEDMQLSGKEGLMGLYGRADTQPTATARALADVAARWRAAPSAGLALCAGGSTATAALLGLDAPMRVIGPGCVSAVVRYRGDPLEGAILRVASDGLLAEDESNAFGDAAVCAPAGRAPSRWSAYAEVPDVARSSTYDCTASGCLASPPLPVEQSAPPPPPPPAPPATTVVGTTHGDAGPAVLTVEETLTTPATRVDAATRQILYYLRLRTGAQPERFSVRMVPPPFAQQGPFEEGQSLDGPRAIALQGQGTLGDQRQEPRIIASCSVRDERFHGYATGPTSVDVALPANTQTTLAVRYATGRRAPWADGSYRMTFEVRPQLVGQYAAGSVFAAGPTAVTPATARTSGPRPGGRIGAHLLLTTTPRAARGSARRIGRRTRIAISGRMLPARARRMVVIEWSRRGGRLRTLAHVRTDARGRFRVAPWRPPGPGTYELWARYPSQAGGLTADRTSCPLLFARS